MSEKKLCKASAIYSEEDSRKIIGWKFITGEGLEEIFGPSKTSEALDLYTRMGYKIEVV